VEHWPACPSACYGLFSHLRHALRLHLALRSAPRPAVMPTFKPERTFELALNPLKPELYPRESVGISAIPLGSKQNQPDLSWSLAPAPASLRSTVR